MQTLILRGLQHFFEYIKLDRDKSTFKSHRDFSSEKEISFKHFGFKKKNQNGTSHVIFTHDLLNRPFPILKHGNSVKEVYVKKAVELVEEINYRKEEKVWTMQ